MAQVLEAKYRETDSGQVIRLPFTEGFAVDLVLPPLGVAPDGITAADWSEVSQGFDSQQLTEVDMLMSVLDLETRDGASDMVPFPWGIRPCCRSMKKERQGLPSPKSKWRKPRHPCRRRPR